MGATKSDLFTKQQNDIEDQVMQQFREVRESIRNYCERFGRSYLRK